MDIKIVSIFSIFLIVFIAGCVGQTGSITKANFSISSPKNWESFDKNVTLKLSVENFKIVQPSDKNVVGEGHFHLFLDNGTYIVVAGDEYTFTNLTPGVHVVKAEMHNNDHSPLGPEKTVMFTVVYSPKKMDFSSSVLVRGNKAILSLTSNFEVVEPGNNKEGQGHFHLFLDNSSYIVLTATNYTFSNLGVGEHKLRITANKNNHSETGVEKTVTFYVPDFSYSITVDSETRSATVKLTLKNFSIVQPSNKLESNKGHFHIFLDSGGYNLMLNDTYTFTNLTAGTHTVKIAMHNNDHIYAGIEKRFVFTV